VTHRLLDDQRAVDGSEPPFLAAQFTTGAAFGTLGGVGRLEADLVHLPQWDLTTELLPQFVSARFDHRVVRDTDKGAFGPIQIHRNLGCFSKQPFQFFG
jgi:hypothetical protein